MPEESSFPFFIHIVTIPLTVLIGFFLGWIFRGAAARKAHRRRGGPGPLA